MGPQGVRERPRKVRPKEEEEEDSDPRGDAEGPSLPLQRRDPPDNRQDDEGDHDDNRTALRERRRDGDQRYANVEEAKGRNPYRERGGGEAVSECHWTPFRPRECVLRYF